MSEKKNNESEKKVITLEIEKPIGISSEQGKALTTEKITEKIGLAGIVLAALVFTNGLFSNIGAKLFPMNDKKFAKSTEKSIEDFNDALKDENITEMNRIINEINKKSKKLDDGSDYLMMANKEEEAFKEILNQTIQLEMSTGRIDPNIFEQVQYFIWDFKDDKCIDSFQEAIDYAMKISEENPKYESIITAYDDLRETYEDTIRRLYEFKELNGKSTAQTIADHFKKSLEAEVSNRSYQYGQRRDEESKENPDHEKLEWDRSSINRLDKSDVSDILEQ